MGGGIVLAPHGFPWRAAAFGIVAFAACIGISVALGFSASGGALLIGGIIAIAVFAGTLG